MDMSCRIPVWRSSPRACAVLGILVALLWLSAVSRAAGETVSGSRGSGEANPVRWVDRTAEPGARGYGVQQAAMPAAEDAPPDPQLRAYPCQPGAEQATAARLQAQLGQFPDVRVVADGRGAQILVLAPPEIHHLVEGMINPQGRVSVPRPAPAGTADTTPPPGALPGNGGQPGESGEPSMRSQSLQLRQTNPQILESQLVGMLAGRLESLTGIEGPTGSYRLATAHGVLGVNVDRRSGEIALQGPGAAVDAAVRLIRALDVPQTADQQTRVVPVGAARPRDLSRVIEAIHSVNLPRAAALSRTAGNPLMATLFQPNGENGRPATGGAQPVAVQQPEPADQAVQPELEEATGLIGPVQIEMLEGLDTLVIRGHQRDVQRVLEIIEQLEELAVVTEPQIALYQLEHVDSEALAALVDQLYGTVYAPRQGTVSITALVKPNAILLIGREENVETVTDLIERLDQPVDPLTQFRMFRLRHAAAATAAATVQEFFIEREALGTRVRVVTDARSNSLIVQAPPRDMAEAAALIARIDTPTGEALNVIRIFKLEHTLAEDLAPILQEAVTGEIDEKSLMLRFITVAPEGHEQIDSGILTGIRVTPDPRTNALIVAAPEESMGLIAALVRELDQLPTAEAQIKVFTIMHSDAQALADMLQNLFAPLVAAPPGVQTAALPGESSLIPLRFGVDVRTNSIIATGSRGELTVVEAILLRLDDPDIRRRRTVVYRLMNAPATDVAATINQFLTSERQVQQIAPGLVSPYEQIEREVVIVAEPVTNSLIVSTTERFFDEVAELVEQLDERPPMVMIQVLIAEVVLDDLYEFGVELGLQDSILFDRSAVVDGAMDPGFAFNNRPLGNVLRDAGRRDRIGTQGLSHFALGRSNPGLGYGGFVFSASSESVSVLIRALQDARRLEILSRPQVMTLDNQTAFIQVGQDVPTITGTQLTQFGQQNIITFREVGLILLVTPRISPDGLVVMELNAEKSDVGPEAEGIPISVSFEGQVVRAPRINTTRAQTTVSALDGQTIVLGGLITKSKSEFQRKVPILGDIPVVGRLFSYEGTDENRSELLIIMTPKIVHDEADADRLKQIEAARMNWCLADVVALHGDGGLRGRADEWSSSETPVIYPFYDPTAEEIHLPAEPQLAPPLQEGFPAGTQRPLAPPEEEGAFLPAPRPPGREPLRERIRDALRGPRLDGGGTASQPPSTYEEPSWRDGGRPGVHSVYAAEPIEPTSQYNTRVGYLAPGEAAASHQPAGSAQTEARWVQGRQP